MSKMTLKLSLFLNTCPLWSVEGRKYALILNLITGQTLLASFRLYSVIC